jgi:hypothetical protein
MGKRHRRIRARSATGQHPADVRRIIPTYTQTPKAVAQKMTLTQWSTTVDAAAMNRLVELSKKYGVLKGDVDVNFLRQPRLTADGTGGVP